MRKDLEKSRKLEQKAKQELTERMQQMQKERESLEEMVRRLKQQHQEEVDELKAKVRSGGVHSYILVSKSKVYVDT